MKQSIFNLTMFLMLVASVANAGDGTAILKEYKQKINKEFTISPDGTVDLTNKYGDIRISSTSSNKVSIEVEITVNAGSQSKADRIFERINIGFANGSDFVSANTEIESGKSWWNKGYDENSGYKIDYYVQLPKSIDLKLANKYGNIYGDDREGDMDVSIKYGDVNIGIVEGDLKLYCGYGKASFVSVRELNATLNYSELKMNRAENAEFTTKYSNIFLDDAGDLEINSKYDDYVIGVADRLTNQGKYDDFKIERVNKLDLDVKYTNLVTTYLGAEADLTFRYGSINIGYVSPNFEELDIETEYTSVKLGFDENANFRFDIEAEYTTVDIPDSYKSTKESRHKNEFNASGYSKGSSASSELNLNMEYGTLKISEKRSE